VSVSAKKKIIKVLTQEGKGNTAQLCRALDLNRSSYYALSKQSVESLELEKQVISKSRDNPRYGYRRITALIRREGQSINAKRVQNLRRKHHLQVTKKQRKTKRVAQDQPVRLRANARKQVWSWDFVHDQTVNGANFRILSVVDEYSKELHSLKPRRSYRAVDFIGVVEELIAEHGAPEFIRSDNGSEFIAYAMKDWLEKEGIKTHYIPPGEPWEQPFVESFHDKLRDEHLNRELYYSLREAEVLLESWRREYNEYRPHSSLDYLTPSEYVEQLDRDDDFAQASLRTTSSARLEQSNITQTQKTTNNQASQLSLTS